MSFIKITAKDLLRGKIVEPGWYTIKVTEMNEKTAKNGLSQNHFPEGEIVRHADSGDTSCAGIPTPQGWCFNEGAPGFAIPFLVACGADEKEMLKQVQEAGDQGIRLRMDDAVGKVLDAFIENGVYEGRTVNRINHKYRAVKNPL